MITTLHLEPPTVGPLKEAALEPLRALWEAVVEHAPAVLSALGLLLVMWLGAKLVRALIVKVLGLTKLDQATEQTSLGKLLQAIDGELKTSTAIASLVYLSILLMALASAADMVGLGAVSAALGAALAYLPRVLSALLVFAIGGYVGGLAKRAVSAMLTQMRSPFAGPLASATEFGILIVVVAVAVDILGVDISFITSNLTVVVSVVLVTVAFLFSWSMRKPAEEIIANYYLRRMVDMGDEINLGEVEGTIERFTSLGVLVRDRGGREHFVPARHVLDGMSCSGRARAQGHSGSEGDRA